MSNNYDESFSFKNIKIETMSDITMILEQDKLLHYCSVLQMFSCYQSIGCLFDDF